MRKLLKGKEKEIIVEILKELVLNKLCDVFKRFKKIWILSKYVEMYVKRMSWKSSKMKIKFRMI